MIQKLRFQHIKPLQKNAKHDAVLTYHASTAETGNFWFSSMRWVLAELPRCQAARDVDQPNNGGNHS